MSNELAKKLAERHPKLFANANLERSSVAPGWFNIIDVLCSDIEAEFAGRDVGIGQVSEKFAALHVQILEVNRDGLLTKRIDEFVKAAVDQCEITCQWCSRPAERRMERGWCRTLCDPCEDRAKTGWRGAQDELGGSGPSLTGLAGSLAERDS